MSSNKPDSGQSTLEARLPKLRKKYFTPPRIRESDGLEFSFGDEHISRDPTPLDPADEGPLACAIRATFPNSHPTQWGLIARRFRELYEGMTEDEAVAAVLNGHSSPEDAIRSRAVRKRKYIGFGPHALTFKQWVTKLAMATDDPTGNFIGDMQRLVRVGKWPKKPVASLDALLTFVRLTRGDKTVLDAATDTWRRYQFWTGVKP